MNQTQAINIIERAVERAPNRLAPLYARYGYENVPVSVQHTLDIAQALRSNGQQNTFLRDVYARRMHSTRMPGYTGYNGPGQMATTDERGSVDAFIEQINRFLQLKPGQPVQITQDSRNTDIDPGIVIGEQVTLPGITGRARNDAFIYIIILIILIMLIKRL